jgi:hypothetical protein
MKQDKPTTLVWLALFVPAIAVAIYGADLPALGRRVDDGIYFATAHSIAESFSYRISSLPGTPFQTKYPPAYPALLSIAWRVPPFPNLPVALLLNWLALPLYVFAGVRLARLAGVGRSWQFVVALGTICGHETLWNSITLLSDLWFSALTLLALLLAGRLRNGARYRDIAAAAIVTNLAYLTRTSGIVLPAAILLVLLAHRRWRQGLVFAAATLPVIVAWYWWAGAHVPAVLADYNDVFNLSYSGQFQAETNWRVLPARVYGKAIQGILSLGAVLQPGFGRGGIALGICAGLIAICAAGYRRLIHLEVFQMSAAFTVLYLAMVLMWPWIFFSRLILPVFPLLLIGFAITLDRVHIPAVLPGFVFGAIYLLSSVEQIGFLAQAGDEANRGAYHWVQTHTPRNATFLADPDSTFWLRTGRRAESLHASVREDQSNDSLHKRLGDLAAFARRRGHEYVFFTPSFLERSWSIVRRDEMQRRLETEPGVEPVYRSQEVTIYRVRP